MESAKNQPVKTKRDIALERMTAKHPDMDFSDKELFHNQVVEDYVDGEDRIAKYEEDERALSDMILADPRAAQILVDMRNGKDVATSLVRMFGSEIKDAIDDPERLEEMAEAQKEYMDRVTKEKEYEDMYKSNLEQTLTNIEAVQKELGLTDDQVDEAMAFLQSIISDGVLGKFSPESIKMAWKALSHDADVAQAAHEGEVKGRNTKIEEKLRKEKKGDGMPTINSKNNNVAQAKRGNSIFDLARQAK